MVTINADIAPKKAKLIGAYNIDQWQNCKHHPTVQVDFGRPAQRLCYLLSQVKLLLRPLSSMTEEEVIPLKRILCDNHGVGTIKEIITKDWYLCNIGVRSSQSFEITKYLLSEGFDLFGLIESGLALEATKIEKV